MVELSVLAVATEWFSKKGGISTFNRELCIALASIGHKVCCFLPEFTTDEENDARNQKVTLVTPRFIPGVPEEAVSYLAPQLPPNFSPDVILGHDRITGPIAQHQKENWFDGAILVYFVHTTPSEIERFKREHSLAEAERREEVQLQLAGACNLVVAVGPLLLAYFSPELAGLQTEPPPIEYINPGVNIRPEVRTRSGQSWILISGRMEDTAIKGLDLAAAAVARFNNTSATSSVLFVRGCAEEHEKKVRDLLQSHLSYNSIKIKPYTHLRERLDADMRKAALNAV